VEVLVPVLAGGINGVVNAIPRGARGLLEKKADVAAVISGRRFSTELTGDGGQQCGGPVSRACDMDNYRGQRHQTRSWGVPQTGRLWARSANSRLDDARVFAVPS
jgi:hypothetical protein